MYQNLSRTFCLLKKQTDGGTSVKDGSTLCD